MDELSFYIGVIGNVISVLVFLSPVGTFWRIIKKSSTEEFESFPYICTLLSSTLWTYYGIIAPGKYLVATVNGFGVFVEAIYVALFFLFAPTKMKHKTVILTGILNIGFATTVILVTRVALHGETRVNATGFMCSGLNILMYASPLAAMKTVIITKSVEYMPFFLSLFLFLNGGIWAIYALLVQDYFLLVPNGAGFILGISQLILYAMYRNGKPSTEQGWQQGPLLPSSSSSSTSSN